VTAKTKIDIGHDMVIQSSSVALRVHIGLPSTGHWLAMSRSQAEKALPILQRFVETGSIEEKNESEAANGD